jgi:prepilin-type N-terminal cleavage/methylation domain-containing protein
VTPTGAMRRETGFTLVEVMISTTIIALVVYLAFQAQSFFVNIWYSNKISTLSAMEDYRAHSLLRNAIESITEYFITDPESERAGARYPYFIADGASVAFVTLSSVFSKGHAAAGKISLKKSSGEKTAVLVYEEMPFDSLYIRYQGDHITYSRSIVIADKVSKATFRYYGTWEIIWDSELEYYKTIKRWQDVYQGKDRKTTPDIIEITLSGKTGDQTLSFPVKSHNPYKEAFFNNEIQPD